MPRPKRKSGIFAFRAPPHPLTSEAREEIVLALGLVSKGPDKSDDIAKIFAQIEKWLGFYKEAASASASLPGPADYRHELSSLERDITKFVEMIREYPEWLRKRISQQGSDLPQIEETLIKAASDCSMARSEYEQPTGLGRRKDESRLKVITELRRLFRTYYREGVHELSAEKAELQRKDAERNFVEIALRDADIPVPDSESLARLLKKPLGRHYS